MEDTTHIPDGNVHVVSCIEGDININTFNK